MVDEHVNELIPEYALGMLADEELIQVARHLPGCARCRYELQSYMETLGDLAYAAPLRNPPPHLKQRILQAIDQQARAVRAGETAGRPGNFLAAIGHFFSQPAGAWLGALALVLALVLGAINLALWQQVRSLSAQPAPADVLVVHLTGTTEAPEASGYLVVYPDESYGTLLVENVPALTPELQYQLWLIRDGQRTDGGVFSVAEDGMAVHQVLAAVPLDSFQSFGITVEPAGGSPGPTGQRIMGGDL